MRRIGFLPTKRQASQLADYLLVQDVLINIEQEDGQWVLWALEDEQTHLASEELKEYRKNPEDKKYRGYARKARKRRQEDERSKTESDGRRVKLRSTWGPMELAMRCPVTLILIGVCVFVTWSTDFGTNTSGIFGWLVFELREIRQGEIWRLFTPSLLHFSIAGPLFFVHLLFNMIWLYTLGRQCELNLNKIRFLFLILAISGISNSAQHYWEPWIIFGGMSGVVYGLFGFIWVNSKFDAWGPYIIRPAEIWILIGWLFLSMTGLVGSVANAAHVMGLVSGSVVGYVSIRLAGGRRRRRKLFRVVGVSSILAIAVFFFIATPDIPRSIQHTFSQITSSGPEIGSKIATEFSQISSFTSEIYYRIEEAISEFISSTFKTNDESD